MQRTLNVMAGHDPAAEFFVLQARELVRNHLRRFPQAADTGVGIALWWLGDAGGQLPQPCLDAALERLARDGVLAWTMLPSGQRLWFAARGDDD